MSKLTPFNDLSEEDRRRILKEIAPHLRPLLDLPLIPPWDPPGSDEFDLVQSAVPLPEIEEQIRQAALVLGEQVAAGITEATRQFSEAEPTVGRKLSAFFDHQLFQGGASIGTGFGETAVTSTDGISASNVTLDDILKTFEKLQRKKVERPYLEAIWFVDVPDDLARFETAFVHQRASKRPSLIDPYIPIHHWDSSDWPPDFMAIGIDEVSRHELAQRLKVPFDGLLPGVWLRISDGRVQHVEVDWLIQALKSGENTPD